MAAGLGLGRRMRPWRLRGVGTGSTTSGLSCGAACRDAGGGQTWALRAGTSGNFPRRPHLCWTDAAWPGAQRAPSLGVTLRASLPRNTETPGFILNIIGVAVTLIRASWGTPGFTGAAGGWVNPRGKAPAEAEPSCLGRAPSCTRDPQEQRGSGGQRQEQGHRVWSLSPVVSS